jgi:1,4-dihydroxy-6-naphthoate synthase
MNRLLSLGYSPCPNDTYIFYAMANGRIDTDPYRFDILLSDVEVLNRKARQNALDITKVSISAVLNCLDDYCLLRAGGAIGRGCGPLVVAGNPVTMDEIKDLPIAVPGRMTTANLLLELHGVHRGPCIEMPFDRIMQAVALGEVAAGVIIHEGRFTYAAQGLSLVLDLGQWWEKEMAAPLPLGGIIVKRELGRETARFVEEKIRESLLYARSNPEDAWPYICSHAQEMEPGVIRQHIDMFVNDFSLDVGEEGERAIRLLVEAAKRRSNLALPQKQIFWDR